MIDPFSLTSLLLVFASVLCLYRTIKGPTVPDRIVAVNVIATCTIVVHVLIAFSRLSLLAISP